MPLRLLDKHTVLAKYSVICGLLFALLPSNLRAEVYELRTYTTNEGKLEALEQRFSGHTMKLFEKHEIENVGYWIPTDEEKSQNTLIYIVKHTSREDAKKSWSAFSKDEDWQSAYKASIADGRLVKKVESVYMDATDYSPKVSPKPESDAEGGLFELRIYNTNEGKLEGLNARFRDHTLGLFKKHGIENVAYWTPSDEPLASSQLIYIIKHKSDEAAKESWGAFVKDEAWKKVAKESQKDGRFLAERPTSIYMKATEYSPLK
ncbi:MAG: NIPSNAP family protein [Pirellulaceae bacterium]